LAKDGLTVKALVVQPAAIVKPGLIQDELAGAGWQLDTRLMEEPGSALPGDLTGFKALVILGGPMNVYEEDAFPYLKQVDRLIREAARKGLPVLGACLGGQLIAKALGALVTRSPLQEIGWYRMQLTAAGIKSLFFRDLPGEFSVFQWHEDTFALPGGASHLAATFDCTNQVFSVEPCILALQFHLEIIPSIIYEWTRIWAEDIEAFHGPGSKEKLEAETAAIWEGYYPIAVRILRNWIELASGRISITRGQAADQQDTSGKRDSGTKFGRI
jgi:GMP synthase-like glutamine amidotransferase